MRPFLATLDGWITRDRVRGYARLLAGANLLCAALWFGSLRHGIDPWGNGLGSDFLTFYAAGALALQGHAAQVFDPAQLAAVEHAVLPADEGVLRWFYPPSFLVLVTPLALLPYAGALAVWISAQLAGLVLLVRRLSDSAAASTLALAFPATLICGLQGQNGFFSAALLGLGLLGCERRPLLAGAALALLTCKPHLAVAAPLCLLAAGRWRALLSFAACATGLVALSVAAFGAGPWLAWPQAARDASEGLAHARLPWAQTPSVFVLLRSLGCSSGVAYVGHALVAAPVLAATFAAWRRGGPLALRVGLAGAASLLASPYVFTYDLVVLVLPLGAVAEHLRKVGGPPGARAAVAALFCAPMLVPVAASLLHVQLGAAAALCAWGLAWRLLREAAPAPARLPAEIAPTEPRRHGRWWRVAGLPTPGA